MQQVILCDYDNEVKNIVGVPSMPKLRFSRSILISSNITKESNPRLSTLNVLPSDIIEENMDGAEVYDGKPRTITNKENSFDTT